MKTESRRDMYRTVERFFNGAVFSRTDLLLTLLSPGLAPPRHAGWVAEACRKDLPPPLRDGGERLAFDLEPCRDRSGAIGELAAYLDRHLSTDLIGACLSGSLGSGEAEDYSDLDAVLIFRDVVLADRERLARAAARTAAACGLLGAFDPLQHHGFFVLTEGMLHAWPDHYFPAEILCHGRALWPSGGLELELTVARDHDRYGAAFTGLCDGVLSQLAAAGRPRNMYELKALLSRFMLLPALYVGARDGRGVWKKESFDLARGDFDGRLWSAMEHVSAIRSRWCCDPSPLQRRLARSGGMAWRRIAASLSPPVPAKLAATLTGGLYDAMGALAAAMKEKAG